jgi:hypothetical protein
MKPNLLLKTWNVPGELPATIGTGGWYNNRVRIERDADTGEDYIEWNDEECIRLHDLSADSCSMNTLDDTRLAPKPIAVRMFVMYCEWCALQMDFEPDATG